MPARPLAWSLALAAALAGAGCVEGPDALRNQGEVCFSCHREGGKAPRTRFTVAGSVFRAPDGEPRESGAAGVAVVLAGADGEVLRLQTNAGGNFTTRKEVRFPVRVRLEAAGGGPAREGPAGTCADGDCNRCHSYERPGVGARGRLVRP